MAYLEPPQCIHSVGETAWSINLKISGLLGLCFFHCGGGRIVEAKLARGNTSRAV